MNFDSMDMGSPHDMSGMRVYISPDIVHPKMQLSEDCPVTPDFRAEVNAWMLEFFGTVTENLVPDNQVMVCEKTGAIYVNPRTFARLEGLK